MTPLANMCLRTAAYRGEDDISPQGRPAGRRTSRAPWNFLPPGPVWRAVPSRPLKSSPSAPLLPALLRLALLRPRRERGALPQPVESALGAGPGVEREDEIEGGLFDPARRERAEPRGGGAGAEQNAGDEPVGLHGPLEGP